MFYLVRFYRMNFKISIINMTYYIDALNATKNSCNSDEFVSLMQKAIHQSHNGYHAHINKEKVSFP